MKEKLLDIINNVINTDENRVNAKLAPKVVDANLEERTSCIEFKIEDWEKNQRDEVHGGIISLMFDTAMGATATLFHLEGQVTTTELQVSYIRPFLNEEYIFESEIAGLGKTLIRVGCKARDKKTGKVTAISMGTYVPYKSKTSEKEK